MKISISIVRNEAGGVAVLPPEHRLRASLRTFEKAAKAKERDAEELAGDAAAAALDDAKAFRAMMVETEASWQELQEKWKGRTETLTFEMRAYTYGEKLKARKAATTWDKGLPVRVDDDEMIAHLLMAVTGLDREQLDALPPIVYGFLASEMMELSEPDPAKLDFFSSAPSD